MNREPVRRVARILCIIALAWASAPTARAAGVRLPAFERATLGNGAEIVLLEKRDTPLVSLVALVRGGALGDPAGKDGTASLLAELIQKGAGPRDGAQFAEAIEGVGGTLAAAAGNESLNLNASFMARDVDLMLELVADALERPRLDAAEFDKARTLAVQAIAAAKDADPRALIDSYGNAWLFRGHPYGRPVGGSEATLAAIRLDDVERFYHAQVGGDRLVVAVVGDFDAATLRSRLERTFGSWRKAGAILPAAPPPARVRGRRVLLVDKPGATQTYFWLGNVGASRTDPARTAQSVVNTAFGGRYTSMLNTALRIDSGLTYGASAGFDRNLQPGSYAISSYTQTDSTATALDLALATLERLHAQALDAATLESSRNYMLGQFAPTLETNGQLASRLAELVFYGLGPEDVDQFAQRVTATDATAVRSTVERSFPRAGDLAVVLIGDAARTRAVAAKYGAVTEMKITDPQFVPAATPRR